MDNRNFNPIKDLLSRIGVDKNHPLFPQLEAFKFEADKLIEMASRRVDALPRPITEPILPSSKEFAKANSMSFETMRKNGWVYANPEFDKDAKIRETVLINDANRADSIVFDNQTYYSSPEFRYENLEAVKFFVSRVLPLTFLENETVPLFLKAWNQGSYSVVQSKFQGEVLQLAGLLGSDQTNLPFLPMNSNGTTFISYDENGGTFLDVINSNFKVQILGKDIVEKHIPGTAQLRYKFHRNNDHPELSGFQLQWVKLSNSGLGKFIFYNMTSKDYEALKKFLATEENSKELIAERQLYSQLSSQSSSKVIDALAVLGNFLATLKPEAGYAINEMTSQILQDPFNPALSHNYLNLSVGLSQGEEIRGALQGVVSAVRSMYASHYLKELLPKVLEKLGETLEYPSVDNLIALQSFQMKLDLLPGKWGNLAKKMKDLFATEAWELTMLTFRLKGNLTGLRKFLVDPEIYHQLLINLKDFARQKDYNVIFANLPDTYANPFTKLKLNKDFELTQGLVDLAIYTILEDLLDSKGLLALDIAAILNAHSPQFIQDPQTLEFSYKLDGIIMSYLDNLILPQMDASYGQKFREAFSKRFQELQDAHDEFLLQYKSILSDSFRTVSTPLTKAAARYPKMWKKDMTKTEQDKTQQSSKEESTKKPEGRKQ